MARTKVYTHNGKEIIIPANCSVEEQETPKGLLLILNTMGEKLTQKEVGAGWWFNFGKKYWQAYADTKKATAKEAMNAWKQANPEVVAEQKERYQRKGKAKEAPSLQKELLAEVRAELKALPLAEKLKLLGLI